MGGLINGIITVSDADRGGVDSDESVRKALDQLGLLVGLYDGTLFQKQEVKLGGMKRIKPSHGNINILRGYHAHVLLVQI